MAEGKGPNVRQAHGVADQLTKFSYQCYGGLSGIGRFCCRSRLREASKRDSVVLTRIAAGAIHDGPSEEGPRSTVLRVSSWRCGSRRSHGAEDRHCSRSVLASQRTCTSLFVDGSAVDCSGLINPVL